MTEYNECKKCKYSIKDEKDELECTLNLNDNCPFSDNSNKTNKESEKK